MSECHAGVSLGSIDLCISCGAEKTSGIQLDLADAVDRRHGYRVERLVAELCVDCAASVTDGLVCLLAHKRKDAVHSAMMAVHALRDAVDNASKDVAAAEAWMAKARKFETPKGEADV